MEDKSVFDVLDVLKHIASFDEDTWYTLTRINCSFEEYAKSKEGVRDFIRIFAIDDSINIARKIGSFDDVWYTLTKINRWFAVYASSNAGIQEFIDCYKEVFRSSNTMSTSLFGELHSFNGEPAIAVLDIGIILYYYNGLYYDHNMPALIDI